MKIITVGTASEEMERYNALSWRLKSLKKAAEIKQHELAHVGVEIEPPDKHSVFRYMLGHGGSFSRILADAWFHGDDENRSRIEATWPELVEKYSK